MGNYQDLQVWHQSRQLTKAVYRHTTCFPVAERYGLTSQMRRATVSIGANIAEGIGRGSDRDTARFLRYALGSTNEVEHHVITSADVRLLPQDQCAELLAQISEIRQMLSGLLATVLRRCS